MKDKAALDAIEAKYGTARPEAEQFEQALRALVDGSRNFVPASKLVDLADVADRDKARGGLYAKAYALLKAAFDREARAAMWANRDHGCNPTGQEYNGRRWSTCSRKSRSVLKFPDGVQGSACFQHEDAMISHFTSQKLRKIWPPDSADGADSSRMLGYRAEVREWQTPGTYKAYVGSNTEERTQTVVTTADVWQRLRNRVETVNAYLPEGPEREAFDKLVDAFEQKYGEI